ncbi:MAG: hypothetical protein MUC68_11465 [Burkholderiaceae bacterium]|jgi:hypothetical protein|nr:hypothetical protein [Burkholderiaceae bacterium]
MADLARDDGHAQDRTLAPPPRDRAALRGALGLALPPAVFLTHFSLLYAANALLCRFDLSARTIAGLPVMTAFAGVVTLLAIVALLAAAHGARNRGTEGQVQLEYDQPARHDFVVKARVMLSWLTVAALLLVSLPVLVARTCS